MTVDIIISWADHKDRTVWVHLYITTSLHRTLLPVAWLVVWLRVPVPVPVCLLSTDKN